jgi:hypothetical protein
MFKYLGTTLSCTIRSFILCIHPQILIGRSNQGKCGGQDMRQGKDKGKKRKVYKVLVGKPEGKRPLERPRHRWEDGIRMYLREIGCGGVQSGSSWLQIGASGGLL